MAKKYQKIDCISIIWRTYFNDDFFGQNPEYSSQNFDHSKLKIHHTFSRWWVAMYLLISVKIFRERVSIACRFIADTLGTYNYRVLDWTWRERLMTRRMFLCGLNMTRSIDCYKSLHSDHMLDRQIIPSGSSCASHMLESRRALSVSKRD